MARDCDVCLINTLSRYELSEELAINIAEKNVCQVILVIKDEIFEEVTEKVEDYGVLTIAKPIQRAMLWSTLKLANVTQRRLALIQKEKDKLNKQIEDIKVINRAKCILISYLGMNESSAHKYIEKQAMDMRMSKRKIAEDLIRTYEY